MLTDMVLLLGCVAQKNLGAVPQVLMYDVRGRRMLVVVTVVGRRWVMSIQWLRGKVGEKQR